MRTLSENEVYSEILLSHQHPQVFLTEDRNQPRHRPETGISGMFLEAFIASATCTCYCWQQSAS